LGIEIREVPKPLGQYLEADGGGFVSQAYGVNILLPSYGVNILLPSKRNQSKQALRALAINHYEIGGTCPSDLCRCVAWGYVQQ
jgi:hypothetical protein